MIQVTIVFGTKYKWNTFKDSWIFQKKLWFWNEKSVV